MTRTRQANIDRIRTFTDLEAGWMWGNGIPITAAAIEKACEIVQDGQYCYPTLEGGIHLETDDTDIEIGRRWGRRGLQVLRPGQ